MRICLPLLALAATLIGSNANAASKTPDEMLAAETAGRIEGKPVSCIYQRDIKTVHVIPRTALVYETNNGTRYVNRPTGAGFLRSDQILVTNTYSPQLCDIDIVQLVDNLSRIDFGSVGLGKFIPYPKPRP